MNFDFTPVLSSLIAGELARTRHISALDPLFLELTPRTEIGRGDLATDSLDLLTLAAAVTEMFHLDETGVDEYLLRYRSIENWAEIVATSLKRKAERITFRSSGSTGTPKRCVHRLEHLIQEAREHAAGLTHCRRVLSMVPSHHIYGFIWTMLIPAELGMKTLDVRRWSPSRIGRELQPGDLLVGVPASWALLARSLESIPSGVFGVTSGARCPDEVFEQVQRSMHLLEVYGSSETAGIGTKSGSNDPFELLSFWHRQEGGFLCRTGTTDTESVRSQDELDWLNERRFRVGSRTDGAVQVNGIKVYPEKVAELIRTHPNIQDCAVRPLDAKQDSRLKAFVVCRSGGRECSEQSLRVWMQSKLQPWEVPARITFGAAIPRNDMNKMADWVTP